MPSSEDEEKKSLLDSLQPRSDEEEASIATGASHLSSKHKIPARGNLRHRPPGAVLGEYFYIGDKPFGVEPGFLAVEISMQLLTLLQTGEVLTDIPPKLLEYKDPLSPKQKIEVSDFLKAHMEDLHTQIDVTKLEVEEPESKIIPITKILLPEGRDSKKIARAEKLKKLEGVLNNLKKQCMDSKIPQESRMALWLIKQDYNEGKPYPPDDRLASTTAVKTSPIPSLALALYRAAKKKTSSFEDESMNAILENLANDIAGLTMQVQEQKLCLRAGDKKTDTIQFVTACRWEPELEMFTGCLAGSASNNKYYVNLERDEKDHIIKGRDLQILSNLPPKEQQKANQYYLIRSDRSKPWELYRTNSKNKLSKISIDEMQESKFSKALPSQLTAEDKTKVRNEIDAALQKQQQEKDTLIEGLRVLNVEILMELPPEAKRKASTSYLIKESEDKPWKLYRIDSEKKSCEVKINQINNLSEYLNKHKKPIEKLSEPEIAIIQQEVMGILYADEKAQLKAIRNLYGEDYHRGPIPLRDENGFFTSDTKLSLGEFAPLMLLLADNDSIGSNGQNKGQANGELFGLDFGHAFRGKSKRFGSTDHTRNPLLDHMRNDFSFDNPKFKNIGSLFYDSELSERMQGMFILYILMGQKNREDIFKTDEREKIDAAIKLYEEKYPKFKEKLSNIQDGGLPEVFKQYKDKMEELINSTQDPTQKQQYEKYRARIVTAEKFSFNSFKHMAKKLKSRMPLGPDAVDLLHNMEKLTSKTSIASENGTVLLKHMRVDDPAKNRVKWRMQIDKDGIVNLDCNASLKRTKELQTILRDYMRQAKTQIAAERQELKLNKQNLPKEEFHNALNNLAERETQLDDFKVDIGTRYTGRAYVKCKEKHLVELCEIFKEDRIKQLKPEVAPTLDVTPEPVKEKLPQYKELLKKRKSEGSVDRASLVGHTPLAESESRTAKKPHKWKLSTTSLFSLFKIKRKVDAEIKPAETPTVSPLGKAAPVLKTLTPEKTSDSSFTSESKHTSASRGPSRRGSSS